MTYREFVDHMKAAATQQVSLITADRDIVPFLVLARGEQVHAIGVEGAWFDHGAQLELVEQLVLPFVDLMRPEFVAWTFTGRRGAPDGEWEHETAVAVCIERERHETWLARLVRHDNRASLGAWRPWPANEQEGRLLTPIQAALR